MYVKCLSWVSVCATATWSSATAGSKTLSPKRFFLEAVVILIVERNTDIFWINSLLNSIVCGVIRHLAEYAMHVSPLVCIQDERRVTGLLSEVGVYGYP